MKPTEPFKLFKGPLAMPSSSNPMPLKKSELYSSLWRSCDELRGGMDTSQYKDYVLVLLFVKYVSDKYAGQNDALLDVPPGGSFADMVALKGDKEIGDKINKLIGRSPTNKATFQRRLLPGSAWLLRWRAQVASIIKSSVGASGGKVSWSVKAKVPQSDHRKRLGLHVQRSVE